MNQRKHPPPPSPQHHQTAQPPPHCPQVLSLYPNVTSVEKENKKEEAKEKK